MPFTYRNATNSDLHALKCLAIKSWSPFKEELTAENWTKLKDTISDLKTYETLLEQSTGLVCIDNNTIIGMAFLVPKGNPTDIYLNEWSYIRFVSVDPKFGGQGIGRKLTTMCIDLAKQNGEQTIALHTSEMMHKAMHIYGSLGFKIVREIDERLGMRYLLYKLELD
jgi:ribosomal protein S18 acetylase RimI-like enzyme